MYSTDTLILKTFSVIDSNIHTISSLQTTEIDSLEIERFKNEQLTDILQYNTPIFFKQYGNGALSSPSFRGTAAQHTKVFWNGLPFNSPMLGMMDFNLFPVLNFNNLQVFHGLSSGITLSSGTLGGAIVIENKAEFRRKKQFQITQEYGSYSLWKNYGQYIISNEKTYHTTALSIKRLKNNFPYKNYTLPSQPIEKQSNAEMNQYAFNHHTGFLLKNKGLLNVFANGHITTRQIPATLTDTLTAALQNDAAMRLAAKYEKIYQHAILNATAGFIADFLHYQDSLKKIDSENYSYSAISSGNYVYYASNTSILKSGWLIRESEAWAKSGYSAKKYQNQIGLYAGYEYRITPKILTTAYLRQEINDFKLYEPLPSIGFVYNFLPKWKWKMNYARMLNFPTLNDLYWTPGGNPDLLPEKGFSTEGILKIDLSSLMSCNIAAFYGEIDNWIQWTPNNSGVFTAQNLKKVEQKGLEAILNIQYPAAIIQYKWFSSYSFTSSVNKESYVYNPSIIGKQLIYVPVHQWKNIFEMLVSNAYLRMEHIFISERFITTDNSWYLPYYNLFNIKTGYTKKIKTLTAGIHLKINNVLNEYYQSIANRPMPPRNYSVEIKIVF